MSFVLNGRVDVVASGSKTPLSSLQRGSYFGEAGILNHLLLSKASKKKKNPFKENNHLMCTSPVIVLQLSVEDAYLLDCGNYE